MTRHPINSCQPMRKTLSPFTLIPIHAHTGCPPIPPEKISKVYNINFVLSELDQIFKWKFRTYHAITISTYILIDQKNRFLSPNGNDQRTKRKEGERWREEIEIMIKRVLKKGEKQEKKIGEKGWRRWGGWNTRKRFSPRKEKSGAPGWW